MKIAGMFPGQGAQYVGMGLELAQHFPEAQNIFDRAKAVLGAECVDVIFSGPEEKLKDTRFTQTSLFVVSTAAFEVLRRQGVEFQFVAGHSVGEYAALCAARVFDFETGLKLVKIRGEAVHRAAQENPGTMAALMGLDRSVVEDVCRRAGIQGVCEPVNFNSPGQVVVAGTVGAVEEAVRLAKEAGALKSIVLNVSGPFHSSLMKSAGETMADTLAGVSLSVPTLPVVMNVDARPTTNPDEIRRKLVEQVFRPVLWEDSLRFLLGQGTDFFIEAGPGRVLCGLLRRTDKSVKFGNIEDKKSADALISLAISPKGPSPCA